MDWNYPDPYTVEITVQSSDIDGMGHTNNASYVVWCEQCAWKHSESLGLSVADYQKLDRGVAINKANYEYSVPSFEGDKLVVGTWLTDCDNKLRLQRRFQIIHSATADTILQGHWLLICVALSSGKPARFPEQFIQIYGGAVVKNGDNPGAVGTEGLFFDR